MTRERKKNAGKNIEPLVNAYKEIRRQLKKEITRSKKQLGQNTARYWRATLGANPIARS